MTKRRHDPRKRRERLARQLIIYGKRMDREDDFVGGVHRPITMSYADMVASYEWARQNPNRWWVRATVYCLAEDGSRYNEVIEAEMQQSMRVNELSEWRLSLLDQARDSVNPRHIVAEGFEMGVV